jgi:imidazole glycerol-phosphate synthase subunit HisH
MIVLIDYDAGNTCSVMNALKRLNADFVLSDDKEVIQKADKVIFPGVGHAKAAMDSLHRKGLVDVIKNLEQPVLGICVGMQLLCESSQEGATDCLGIVPLEVQKFDESLDIKVPHMGWNELIIKQDNSLLKSVKNSDYVYFVHSYYVPVSKYSIANCIHGNEFSAAVKKDNFYGIQFHAEKSGVVGAQILSNFINKDI